MTGPAVAKPKLYTAEIATLVAVAVVVALTLALKAPFRVMASVGATAELVVPTLFGVYVLLLPVAAIAVWRSGRHKNPATDPRKARVWVPFLRLAACFTVAACAYSFLGSLVPLVNPRDFGPALLSVDTVLGFGTAPNQALGSITHPAFAEFMRLSYLSYLLVFPLVTAFAVFRADLELVEDLFQGFVLAMLLGAAIYFVLPVQSTLYSHPQWHSGLLGGPVGEWRAQLLAQHEALRAGQTITILPFSELAAFPSLHVAEMLIAILVVGRKYKAYRLVALPHFGLILVSTVYTGQHFVVDWIGAVPLAIGVVWLVGKDRQRRSQERVAPAAEPEAAS